MTGDVTPHNFCLHQSVLKYSGNVCKDVSVQNSAFGYGGEGSEELGRRGMEGRHSPEVVEKRELFVFVL